MRKIFLSFLFLATLGFFLPQIASTYFGKKQVEAHLTRHLGGTVHVESICLKWWGEQVCKNVSWTDPKNGITSSADTILITANLLDCLQYKEKPLEVLVEGATISCKANFRFLKKKRQALEMHFSPIKAQLKEGTIQFEETEIDVTESLRVITWGNIDLIESRMNLTLGFPSAALNKLFGMKDLPDDYCLEIPISSKLNGRSLEKRLIKAFVKNYATVTSLQR